MKTAIINDIEIALRMIDSKININPMKHLSIEYVRDVLLFWKERLDKDCSITNDEITKANIGLWVARNVENEMPEIVSLLYKIEDELKNNYIS